MEVPTCPPGPESEVANHLRVHGWEWGEDRLLEVVGQLAHEEVGDRQSLFRVDLSDIVGVDQWPPEVRAFMQRMVRCVESPDSRLCT